MATKLHQRLHYLTKSYCSFCGEYKVKREYCPDCGYMMRQRPRRRANKMEYKRY